MRGLEVSEFSAVVSEVYDCALNPAGWNSALTRIASLMDAAYATISLADMPYGSPVMANHSPWDPEALRILNEDYGVEGVPGLKDLLFKDLDIAQSTMDQMSEAEFQESPFYRDWVKPQGLRDACVMKFAQTGNRLGVVGVVTYATRDIVSADERHFMQLVSPHLRRAALIGDLLNQERLTTHLYKQTLAALATPVILTDAFGKLVFANPAADSLLSDGQLIRSSGGRVSGTNPLAAKALTDAISRAAAGEKQLGGRGIGIPLSNTTGDPVVAYVLPLTHGSLRGSYESGAVAIFINSGIGATLPPESMLVTLFELTRMEARVMRELSGGASRSACAAQLGMSENTLKTHLSRLFTKTETKTRAELQKLVLSISQPVV